MMPAEVTCFHKHDRSELVSRWTSREWDSYKSQHFIAFVARSHGTDWLEASFNYEMSSEALKVIVEENEFSMNPFNGKLIKFYSSGTCFYTERVQFWEFNALIKWCQLKWFIGNYLRLHNIQTINTKNFRESGKPKFPSNSRLEIFITYCNCVSRKFGIVQESKRRLKFKSY